MWSRRATIEVVDAAKPHGDELERVEPEFDYAVGHIERRVWLFKQVAPPRPADALPIGNDNEHVTPIAECLVAAHDEIAAVVVGELDGVDSDARHRTVVGVEEPDPGSCGRTGAFNRAAASRTTVSPGPCGSTAKVTRWRP